MRSTSIISPSDHTLLSSFLKKNRFATLLIASKSYLEFTAPVIQSILCNSISTPPILCLIDATIDDLDVHLTSAIKADKLCLVHLCFSHQFSDSLSYQAFCANSRALVLHEITVNHEFEGLIYLDVDSLVWSDLRRIIHKLNKHSRFMCFRDQGKCFHPSFGYMPFKSGVIGISYSLGGSNVGASTLLTDRKETLVSVLAEYAEYVSRRITQWYSDQRGLVAISISSSSFPYLLLQGSTLNDWDMTPCSLIWSAKGRLKHSLVWKISSLYFRSAYSLWHSNSPRLLMSLAKVTLSALYRIESIWIISIKLIHRLKA